MCFVKITQTKKTKLSYNNTQDRNTWLVVHFTFVEEARLKTRYNLTQNPVLGRVNERMETIHCKIDNSKW